MKKHLHKIAWVEPGSIAEELGLEPGDAIEEINGNEIEDIFDYQYYVEDESFWRLRRMKMKIWELLLNLPLWTNIIPAVISVCSVLLIRCRRE